jgi:hypothetical protein
LQPEITQAFAAARSPVAFGITFVLYRFTWNALVAFRNVKFN